jgi:hypothetical protein
MLAVMSLRTMPLIASALGPLLPSSLPSSSCIRHLLAPNMGAERKASIAAR